ncbi:MAG TPA: hypothetical protein VGB24_19310 [Longimicrobium sp.]|jgi:hypothetical protein|uniref:hypothetical protein n=1 Tax=Longimicrobium sp. TaxID=2029185 RepID=UPI002ED90D8E
MKLSVDRALRAIWLAIGVLLLGFLLVFAVVAVTGWIRTMGADEAAVRVARESGQPREEARAVRVGMPDSIRGSSVMIAMVGNGRDYLVREFAMRGYAGHKGAPMVNVMFLDDQGARLLLDRAAYITEVRYPRPRDPSASTSQNWISYQVAMEDGNGNGQLDDRDPRSLYVTDLEGRNLRPVIRPPMRLLEHQAIGPGRILVYALEPPQGQQVAEDRMRQRAFVYETATGKLLPFTALDAAADRAAGILAR